MAEGLERRWQDALAHEDISIKQLDRPALVLAGLSCETSFRPVLLSSLNVNRPFSCLWPV